MRFEKILSKYAGKRILVTGGAGCIGSNLVRALLNAEPEQIIVIDDLSASYRWNIPEDPTIAFVQGSILDDEKMKEVFKCNPHYVFHLAAHFANQNSIDHPETDLLTNALGTLKTLQYSRGADIKRFVYASSGCSVYGNQAPLPLKEDFISLHLDTPYQITKLVGELYSNFFYSYYKLPITVARYFNVYGSGEVPGQYRNVIPNFMWLAMNNTSLPITGTGEETRDFTFVEDVVDGTLRLGVLRSVVGEAVNLASGTETKIIEIANLINAITENEGGVVFKSVRDWDRIERRRASIEKARKLLGYSPKEDIATGLRKTYDWFMANKGKIKQSVGLGIECLQAVTS
jgi:nucleoside-diphosphate-sugar epimerase